MKSKALIWIGIGLAVCALVATWVCAWVFHRYGEWTIVPAVCTPMAFLIGSLVAFANANTRI